MYSCLSLIFLYRCRYQKDKTVLNKHNDDDTTYSNSVIPKSSFTATHNSAELIRSNPEYINTKSVEDMRSSTGHVSSQQEGDRCTRPVHNAEDDVYDISSHTRQSNTSNLDQTYDHFFGQTTEDDYNITRFTR